MKFLAINTAGSRTEAAVVNGEKRFVWSDGDFRRASEILLPKTDELLDRAGLRPDALDFVACVTGPGSFTGIRIGVTTVRALCYAENLEAVCVTLPDVLAYNERADGAEQIAVVTDGSNGTAYFALYDGGRMPLSLCEVIAASEIGARLGRLPARARVCCDENLLGRIPGAVAPDGDCASLIRAVSAHARDRLPYTAVEPFYVRVSQAEKDLEEREKHGRIP